MDQSPAPEETAPHRHAPLALWCIAQGFLNVLYAMFGAAEDAPSVPRRAGQFAEQRLKHAPRSLRA